VRKAIKPTLAVLFAVVVLIPIQVFAQSDWEVEWSGFFSSYFHHTPDEKGFVLGPTEVDFFAQLHPRFSANGALVGEYEFATNSADIGVGVAYLEVLLQEEVSHKTIISNTGLAGGLFDVPFGIDYLLYADPDRWNISTPITADKMFDGGWTDVGAMFFSTLWMIDLKAYSVNGYTERPAIGTTVDFIPVEWVHAGASYTIGLNATNDIDWDRIGGHGIISYAGIEFCSEYIIGNDNKATTAAKHKGFYGQGTFDFTDYFFPFYIGARYGMWQPDYDANGDTIADNDDLTRITGYFGIHVIEPVTVKFEYQMNKEEGGVETDNDEIWFGAVTAF